MEKRLSANYVKNIVLLNEISSFFKLPKENDQLQILQKYHYSL